MKSITTLKYYPLSVIAVLLSCNLVNTVNFANAADTRTLDLGGNVLTVAGSGILVGTNAAAITGTGISSQIQAASCARFAPLALRSNSSFVLDSP